MARPADAEIAIDACLAIVEPERARGDVQFWGVLAVLPAFLLGARFGLDLAPAPALGAAVAAWLPVLLVWWNRHAEREHARIEEAVARFEAAFPVKGVGRPQALATLGVIAADAEHVRHQAAHLLIAELDDAGAGAPGASTARTYAAPDLEYRGPGAFTGGSKSASVHAGEPLLPPELQDAIPTGAGAGSADSALQGPAPGAPSPAGATAPGEAQSSPPVPPLDPIRTDAAACDAAAPDGDVPAAGSGRKDRFDYIPLDPHEPER